jgi:hypothetical protein
VRYADPPLLSPASFRSGCRQVQAWFHAAFRPWGRSSEIQPRGAGVKRHGAGQARAGVSSDRRGPQKRPIAAPRGDPARSSAPKPGDPTIFKFIMPLFGSPLSLLRPVMQLWTSWHAEGFAIG